MLLGVLRLMRFRTDGWDLIAGTRQMFLNSLPPLLAFPVLSSLWAALQGGAITLGLTDLLATLVALLAPAVLSEALARRWRCDAAWLRYAVGFNWCQFAVAIGGAAAMFVAASLLPAGPARASAAGIALLGTAIYALALQWFLVRSGLGLGSLRAVAFTLFVNAGTGMLALGPTLIAEGGRH